MVESTPSVSPDFVPRVLVTGPMGAKIFQVLGFLLPLQEGGYLDSIDTYCGSSGGALISLLLILGYGIREIIEKMVKQEMFNSVGNLVNLFSRDISNFTSILSNKGLIPIDSLRKKISRMVIEKHGFVPTLNALYMNTAKSLVIFTLNTTTNTSEIITPVTHPNLNCVEAVLQAINLPFLYQQNATSHLIDFSLANSYPVDYFDDGNTDILGVYIKSKDPRTFLISRTESIPGIDTFTSHCYRMLNAILEQKQDENIRKCGNRCRHVALLSRGLDPIGYTSGLEDKTEMLIEGNLAGLDFISHWDNYAPVNDPEKWKYSYPEYFLEEEN